MTLFKIMGLSCGAAGNRNHRLSNCKSNLYEDWTYKSTEFPPIHFQSNDVNPNYTSKIL